MPKQPHEIENSIHRFSPHKLEFAKISRKIVLFNVKEVIIY